MIEINLSDYNNNEIAKPENQIEMSLHKKSPSWK